MVGLPPPGYQGAEFHDPNLGNSSNDVIKKVIKQLDQEQVYQEPEVLDEFRTSDWEVVETRPRSEAIISADTPVQRIANVAKRMIAYLVDMYTKWSKVTENDPFIKAFREGKNQIEQEQMKWSKLASTGGNLKGAEKLMNDKVKEILTQISGKKGVKAKSHKFNVSRLELHEEFENRKNPNSSTHL